MHHASPLYRPPTPEVRERKSEDELATTFAQQNEVSESLQKAYDDVFQTLFAIKLSDGKSTPHDAEQYATRYTSALDTLLGASPHHLTLTERDLKLIQKLGKQKAERIWPLLQAYAKALQYEAGQPLRGIQAVTLPGPIGLYLPALLRGIGTLGTLEYLEVAAPRGREPLDLRPLTPNGSIDLTVKVRLPESDLQGRSDSREERVIWISEGTRVMAKEPTAQVEKYVVWIGATPDSQPARKVRLGGVMHHPHPATGMDPSMNLNGEGTLAPDSNGRRSPAVCRHLATAFLLERQSYLQHKRDAKSDDGAPRMHFSFKSFASAKAISNSLPPDIQMIYDRAIEPENLVAITTGNGFSSALSRQFESMPPGSVRHILLVSFNHVMALELQAKTGAAGDTRAYTARFYDPNATRTAPRLDFQTLHDVNAQSIKPLTDRIWHRAYHAPSQGVGVDESDSRNSLFMYVLGTAGTRVGAGARTPPERHGITDILESLQSIPKFVDFLKYHGPAFMLELCRCAVKGVTDLETASHKLARLNRYFENEPSAAAPFLRFTFSELPKFQANDYAKFLFELYLRYGVRSAATDPTQIAPVTRLIAGVTSDRLPKHDQWSLLADSAFGPLQMGARFAEGRYQAQPARLESTYAAVHEIALSKVLTDAEKAALVAGFEKHPNETSFWERLRHTPLAQQACEAGDTDMALAMATAILDARLEKSETAAILKGLGIDLEKLLTSKLEAFPTASPIGGWLGRALQAATTSNWADKDAIQGALVKKKGGTESASLSLLSSTRLQRDGKGVEPMDGRSRPTWEGVQLIPLARDTNSGFMVCSSPDVPEHLRGNLVDPNSRPSTTGLTIPAGHQLVLVPVDDVATRTVPGPAPLVPAGAPAPALSPADPIGRLQGAAWLEVTGPDMPTSQTCREAQLRFIRPVMGPDSRVTHIECRANRNLAELQRWQAALFVSEGAAVNYIIPVERLTPGR